MTDITAQKQGLVEGVHYFIPRTHFQTKTSEQRTAWEHEMSALELTFERLAQVVMTQEQHQQVAKNLVSALRKFVEWRQMSMNDVVGRLFRTDFYPSRRKHLSDLKLEGRSPGYIANRASLLSKLRSIVMQIDRAHALKTKAETPLQAALNDLVAAAGDLKLLSSRTQVPLRKLEGYMRGTIPGRNGERELQKLERYFAMQPGALTDLIPRRTQRPWSRTGKRVQMPMATEFATPYCRRLAAARKDPYRVKPADAPERLRREWIDLLHFKTDLWAVPSIGKLSRRWTCLPFPERPQHVGDWIATVNGQWCPTAKLNYETLSNYVGWLMRDRSAGGAGLSPDVACTMARVADVHHIRRHADWLIARSGGIVSGSVWRLLTFAAAMCQPDRGFLWHYEEIGLSAGYASAEWKKKLADAFAAYRLAQKNFKPRLATSRDPFARIANIIALDNPMEAVWDAMDRMKRDRPPAGGEAELIWARNYLLLGLLASNPLRVRNMLELNWRSDNTGHLRKDPDGSYRIFFAGRELKNRYGYALTHDYNVPVQAALTPFIDEYLNEYWTKLTKGRTDRIFVGTLNPERSWMSMSETFFEITAKYFVGTPGFRPHAMRHITATALVKETGGFTAAALVLHDKEATVRQHYGFVIGEDGARWMAKVWKRGRWGA